MDASQPQDGPRYEAAPPVAPPVAPSPEPRRPRRRAWPWVLGVGLVVLLGFLGCCGVLSLGALSGQQIPVTGAVAVIYLDEAISGVGNDSTGITPEHIIRQLKRAEKDPRIKAIVLRVNSPGGTSSASSEIALEISRVKKPIVASIGDVGASGAYWAASQCDYVMSSPSSAVGSIGVIQQFPNVEALMDKIGVKYRIIHEGEFKDAGSPFRELTATETAMFEKQLKLVYDEFIEGVAKGRDMEVSKVRELATGWVWTGTEAKDLGLVDGLGNYSDAVREAGKRGGIEGDPPVVVYDQPAFSDLLGTLVESLGRIGPAGVSYPDPTTSSIPPPTR